MPFSNALDLGSLDKIAVEELPTANGPADYGLFVDGKLLGIVEAKKVTVNPQNVLEQAKRYAAGVFAAVGEWDGLRVPFLYASNGTIIWHLDTRPAKRVSRPISDFHTPEALAGRARRNSAAPLLTAEERVQAGIAELRAFHTFTPEQAQWLDLIARHLVENLCVDTSDLETQPVFTSKGGLGRARKVFGDQLGPLIERLNYTLAA